MTAIAHRVGWPRSERARTAPETDARIQIAAITKLHVVVDGAALCGNQVDPADLYEDDAGLRVWNSGEIEHCGQCVHMLTRGAR